MAVFVFFLGDDNEHVILEVVEEPIVFIFYNLSIVLNFGIVDQVVDWEIFAVRRGEVVWLILHWLLRLVD